MPQGLGAAHDAFLSHQEIGAGLRLGAAKLARRNLVGYVLKFAADHGEKLLYAGGVGSGIDAQKPYILKRHVRGRDIVNKSLLLAYFLKQPRRRAAAQKRS